jgi:hypothetical protein
LEKEEIKADTVGETRRARILIEEEEIKADTLGESRRRLMLILLERKKSRADTLGLLEKGEEGSD